MLAQYKCLFLFLNLILFLFLYWLNVYVFCEVELKGDRIFLSFLQCIINHQALPYLVNLLSGNYKKGIKKEACWTISNITAGNKEQIQVSGKIRPVFQDGFSIDLLGIIFPVFSFRVVGYS